MITRQNSRNTRPMPAGLTPAWLSDTGRKNWNRHTVTKAQGKMLPSSRPAILMSEKKAPSPRREMRPEADGSGVHASRGSAKWRKIPMMAINPAETRKADAYPRLSAMSPPKALPHRNPAYRPATSAERFPARCSGEECDTTKTCPARFMRP